MTHTKMPQELPGRFIIFLLDSCGLIDMCGIAGILCRSPGDGEDLAAKVTTMVSAIRHRGPDGDGVWCHPQGLVTFGHARLAIIDLSDDGKQPMTSHSGNLVLTFNGEIYNYVELRHELGRAGTEFRGTSDTEVLLEAMGQWGIETALSRARGMFALAVWDNRQKYLWLARDRVGKKPLYIFENTDSFMFASEIKGLLAVPSVKVNISQQSLSDYLSLGYVPGPDTIYREISEVRPGTLVRLDMSSRLRKETVYWSFPTQASRTPTPEEIQEQTESLLNEAVRIRLRADVPVGVFLSGGIDSGLITALAATQSAKALKTFTVSFGTSVFDESELAGRVAQRYDTDHHEIRLNPDLEDLLPKVVGAYDEPFADPSALPTFAISSEASKHVKVVLNGEGSDELFGGYRRIYAMRALERIQFILKMLPRNTLSSLLSILPKPKKFRSNYSFFHRFARAAQADGNTRYLVWSSDGFDIDEKQRLQLSDTMGVVQPTYEILRDRMANRSISSPLAEFMAIDFLVGMADCLLPKIDIATMAHGLEGRSPFLDQELVDWVAGVDKTVLLAGRGTKPVLRAMANQYLPPEVVSAPKRGFEIPLVQWMTNDLKAMVRDVCTSESSILFDLFDRSEVLAIVDRQYPIEDERWAKRMWSLFMLASWGSQR